MVRTRESRDRQRDSLRHLRHLRHDAHHAHCRHRCDPRHPGTVHPEKCDQDQRLRLALSQCRRRDREKRDAEWLALQMSHAAGVKAAPSVPDYSGAEQMEIMTSFIKDFRAGKVLPNQGRLTNAMSELSAPIGSGPIGRRA